MGCFLACFGSSKDGKRGKQRLKVQPRNQGTLSEQITLASGEVDSVKAVVLVSEIRNKPEEELSPVARKKVTFDSTVKIYDHIPSDEPSTFAPEIEESTAKPCQTQSSSKDAPFTSKVGSYTPNKRYQNCRDGEDGDEGLEYNDSDLDDHHVVEDRSMMTKADQTRGFTPNNRYQNCRNSDDEDVGLDYSDSDLDVDDDDNDGEEELGDANYVEDTNASFSSVLTPIENLTQWRAAKAKPVKDLKENLTFNKETKHEEPKKPSQEVSVDASLSNWLVSSESASINMKSTSSIQSSPSICGGSNSLLSLEDRPILGVLTVEDLRQCSVTSSPRRSPSKSPDEMPIIGSVGAYWNNSTSANSASCNRTLNMTSSKQREVTSSPRRSPSRSPDDMPIIGSVGSYWNDSALANSAASFKGIPNTTSKYREDKKVSWHSTPFEARLERALNKTAARTDVS